MDVPSGSQIGRMSDGERAALAGWIDTERAHEASVQKSASVRAATRRKEAEAADAEVEASRRRVQELDVASSFLAGTRKVPA
jgi:ferric-dicitrate binding protein FerR (iron transport regulator)